jgi:hypothetical protein
MALLAKEHVEREDKLRGEFFHTNWTGTGMHASRSKFTKHGV